MSRHHRAHTARLAAHPGAGDSGKAGRRCTLAAVCRAVFKCTTLARCLRAARTAKYSRSCVAPVILLSITNPTPRAWRGRSFLEED